MSPEPAIRLSSPDAVIAAVPYLLGFHPSRSAVMVWSSSTDHRIELTMRFDLPPGSGPEASRASMAAAMRTLVRAPLEHLSPDAVPVVVIYPETVVPGAALPHADLVAVISEVLAEADRPAFDLLCVSGDRWWSYLCEGSGCCDLCGNEVSTAAASEVAAACVLAGMAPVETRERLVEELAPESPAAVRRVRTALTALGAPMRRRRAGDTLPPSAVGGAWSALTALALSGSAAEPADQAQVLLALRDLRYRDAFLALTVQRGGAEAIETLAGLVRLAPRHYRAQAAASVALLRYVTGDGARAWVAVDAALADDRDCSLAALVAQAVGSGMPPSGIREVFGDMDPEDLRHGRIGLPAA